MKQRKSMRFLVVAAVSGAVLVCSTSAMAAPLRVVSGRVCGVAEPSGIRSPEPGELRCTNANPHPGNVRVTIIDKSGKIVTSTRSRRDGRYRMRARPGEYRITVEGASYTIKLKVGATSVKNVDVVLGIVFLAEGS